MDTDLKEQLAGLERTRARAWLERDPDLLAGLLDEDFIEINYFGRLTRDEILGNLFPALVLRKFDMDGLRLLASSGPLAILSYKAYEEINYKGNDIAGTFHVTAVYRKNGGKWLLLIWQLTPYMPEKS
ncbi:MAG TPA: nuclear transport factor 2 family protein [Thermodesulfobacteriota bacterium]|nr:nuclear transport factor 2 family protein [Thermodesulfobacteriota bacterium]